MLQPDRLQPGIAPLKVKKMPNVQFKTAWKFPETGGKSRKKAEKTGRLRKFAERVGKIRTFSNSGPKGRGNGEKRSPSGGIAEGDSDSSLLARNERRARSRREQRQLSERYRIPSRDTAQWTVAKIEIAPRKGISPLRLPEALIFLCFRVFRFWRFFRFSGLQPPG